GGGHGGGAGHGGGGHGGFGGAHRGYGYHGGYAGGRSGYSYRGGYGGWRGGYGGWRGGYGYYGGWGLLGYGLFFSTLPLYYSTFWWDGIPYYYGDDNYFMWNEGVGQYETVRPPAEVANQVATQAPTDLFAYPKSGQSTEQQARDRYECHRWAADQSGFDPAQSGGVSATAAPQAGNIAAAATAAAPNKRQEYMRAQ